MTTPPTEMVSRRQLFKRAWGYAVNHATDIIAAQAARMMTARYLRPPGALPEPEFLSACIHCEACVTVCPHFAISMLPPETEGAAARTPVITPQRQPCMMCDDLPCVRVCEPNALVRGEEGKTPSIGTAGVDASRCWSAQGQDCSYCRDECLRHSGAIDLTPGAPPEIDERLCDGCGKCEYICPVPDKAAIVVVPGER